ncbi:MAG: hypothetical protein Q4A15_03585 [Prevotellaceae bacterium]|nr:hypothetical protein [Prevotellaceae bacterium]
MKKFKVQVTRIDEYEIEIDETIINDEWIKHFESYMWPVDEDEPHRELAEHIAQMRARFGSRQFMEGFGLMNVESDYFSEEEKKELAPGFKVKVIDEDNTLFFDTMECKQTEETE